MSRFGRLGVTQDAALAALLAVALGLIVFVATGGTDLGPNTWIQLALIAAGAGGAIALLLSAPGGRSWGGATVALFAALAALSYLSIAWSVQPATSWLEANRTLSYLGAFGAAVALARLAPGRWKAVLGGVGAVAVIACGYALLTKVFPATFDPNDAMGRIRPPFDYWNATGLMAALGLPICLWAGARPEAGRIMRILTVPALAILLSTLVLSFSRGTLVAAVIGLGCWLAVVPFRLRAVLWLALGAAGGAIASGWALAHHALTRDGAALPARTSAGHGFGLVLLGVLALTAVAGLVAVWRMDRTALSPAMRRRIGTALLILVALVPLAGIAGAATSSRGLTGEISHVWSRLTSTSSGVNNAPGRLGQLGNSRPLYWSEGLKVGEHSLLAGAGAGGYQTARTRYTTNPLAVGHAHSYLVETFADFGLIGIAVTLALFVAWIAAVRRTLSGTPDDPRHAAERVGLFTLLAVVVTFGVSSLIDWTWFIPGVTVPALICAGWLAGRGPLAPSAPEAAQSRSQPGIGLGRLGGTIAIAAALLIVGWFVWQPLHSFDEVTTAIDAMARQDTGAALAAARSASAANPVSVDPLFELSAIYSSLSNPTASRQELVKATQVQPANAQTWQQLGWFDLQAKQPRLALAELETALRLDRTSPITRQLIDQALASAVRARTGSA